MLANVSPYALLRASMPRQSAAATAYDLYSLAQTAPAEAGTPDARETPAGSAAPATRDAPAARQAGAPAGRTHYIADIKSRHQLAANRASFSPTKH